MAGMRGLQGVVQFGRNLAPDVVAWLGFTGPKTLAKSTLSEILRAIDIEAFEAVVGRWLQGQADRHGWTAIAIDGKSLRGATGEQLPAVHRVAADAHEARVVLAELRVDAQTNESPPGPGGSSGTRSRGFGEWSNGFEENRTALRGLGIALAAGVPLG